jgi:hypothetical protein
MKILFSLVLGRVVLTTQTAVAAHHPKVLAKRVTTPAKEARKLKPNRRFRRSPRPAPLLGGPAPSLEKFKNVHAASNYKFK